jgi:hypothetical protein
MTKPRSERPGRIIELAYTGERDPERLRAVTLSWVTE